MIRIASVQEFVAVTGHLVALMNRESDLLDAAKPEGIAPLQDEKAALSRSFVSLMAGPEIEPEGIEFAGTALREDLRKAICQFNAAALRNERALRLAREVNERLMRAVIDATLRQREAGSSYCAGGVRAPVECAAALAVAVDQSL